MKSDLPSPFIIVATVRASRLTPKLLQKLYENWLRENAQKVFEDKVKKYSKKLGAQPKLIVIKNLRHRWGSLTKNGVLNLNLNLIKAPEDVIDYIILHDSKLYSYAWVFILGLKLSSTIRFKALGLLFPVMYAYRLYMTDLAKKIKNASQDAEAEMKTSKDHAEGKPSSENLNKAKVKVRDALT